MVLAEALPEVLVFESVVLPLKVDLHREGEHHVDGVNPVNVQDVHAQRNRHRLGRVGRVGRRVLEVRGGDDDLFPASEKKRGSNY